jgi:hypothetical protein
MTYTTQSVAPFRAAPANERATGAGEHVKETSECAHSVITDEKSPLFTRDSGMLADSQSVEQDSAVVRVPMGKAQAAGAYTRALQALRPLHSWHFWGIQEYVRCLRAEAASWRTRAQTAEREIALLKIQLEEATHE